VNRRKEKAALKIIT